MPARPLAASEMSYATRSNWATLSNAELLGQCEVDTYRASGPGGQKRNKTSSAVRLRHRPSGLIVIAEESRSQHENKSRALRRLRKAIFLELREEIPADSLKTDAIVCRPELTAVMSKGPKLECSPKRPEFWPAVGLILDLLAATQSRVSETASLIGVSTGNLIGFLEADAKVWQKANGLRAQQGQKPLRSSSRS